MVVARVDKDYLYVETNAVLGRDPLPSRIGFEFELRDDSAVVFDLQAENAKIVRFRCLDDDGQVYYGGWLYNDSACEVQLRVIEWAAYDAGASEIQVMLDNEWTTEINY